MKIYLSGPISQNPKFREEFQEAALRMRKAGFDVINPVELVEDPASWEDAMKQDLKAMLECDGVAVVHTKHTSRGMGIEMMLAGILGMTCMAVEEYLHGAVIWNR